MFATKGVTRSFTFQKTGHAFSTGTNNIERQLLKPRCKEQLRLSNSGGRARASSSSSSLRKNGSQIYNLQGSQNDFFFPKNISSIHRAFSVTTNTLYNTTSKSSSSTSLDDLVLSAAAKQEASNVVNRIKADLKSVDANSDGRIDTEEFKSLLRKHASIFTEEEIVELGELYYAGKAGGSVPIDDFLGALENIAADKALQHPILDGKCSAEYIYRKTHDSYTPEELNISLTHKQPKTFSDKMALNAVKVVRGVFDTATGWNYDTITKEKVLNRVIFLETIAAVPGMVAAITRHFKSLRSMERDGGLMHVFLEEANNERMHLLSFIKMKDPSPMFRAAVIASQFGFGTGFLLSYMASPKFCHRFVGYIEEEACTTYTKIVKAIEDAPEESDLAQWRTEVAPSIARGYWKLGEDGTVLDLMYAVRADEAEHRDVNHACSELEHGNHNPFNDPEVKLNQMLRKYVKDIMSREDKLVTSA